MDDIRKTFSATLGVMMRLDGKEDGTVKEVGVYVFIGHYFKIFSFSTALNSGIGQWVQLSMSKVFKPA